MSPGLAGEFQESFQRPEWSIRPENGAIDYVFSVNNQKMYRSDTAALTMSVPERGGSRS